MSVPVGNETVLARVDELERELRELRAVLAPPGTRPAAHAGRVAGAAPPRRDGTQALLLCRAAGRVLAIPLGRIAEVLPAAALLQLPDAEASVLGALNLRGVPLVIVDLGQRLGEARSPLGRTDIIVACEIDGERIGLKIDGAMDVVHARMTPLSGHVGRGLDAGLLLGAIVHAGEPIVVLDVTSLARHARNER